VSPSPPSASGEDSLSSSAPLAAATSPHPFATPEAARYLPTDHLGRGGMGRVTAVFDRRLGREVARKDVPSEAPDIDSLERRLEREARITARLDHPGIVPIHDAGTDPTGHPYFTMRFIRGRSLGAALSARDLAPTTLLRRFLSVCDAVAHAHARGVVHRDLKPDNIMLGPHGETQVVDWGVARVLEDTDLEEIAAGSSNEGHTVAGARVGTLAWMSPEQARGEPVGPSSDVFSLGLVLREIVSTMAAVEPELRAIQSRATASAPEDRYADAGALALDLAAYLDGRRVSAFSYSPLDLARRFYRAFRAPILIAVVAVTLVLAVLVVAYTETRHERDLAELAEARAEAALRTSEHSYVTLLVERAIDAWRQGARAEAELLAAAALERKDSPEARAILSLSAPFASLESASPTPSCHTRRLAPDGLALACLSADTLSVWALTPSGEPSLRWEFPSRWSNFAWLGGAHLLAEGRGGHEVIDVESSAAFTSPQGFEPARARSTAGRALLDSAEALFVYDVDTATANLILEAPRRLPWALSGDGKVALTYDEATRSPQWIDLETTAHRPIGLAMSEGPMSAALSFDGSIAAFGNPRGRLVIFDTRAGTSRGLELSDRPLTHLEFSPDGRWLAARDERGFVSVVPMAHARSANSEPIALPRVQVESLIWRGDRLMTLGVELLTWRLPEVPRAVSYRATAGISALALARDGGTLALADGAGALSLYDLESGGLKERLPALAEGVAKDVAFVNNSEIEISCDGPAVAAIWPGRFETATWCPPHSLSLAPGRANYRRLVVLADGAMLAATYGGSLDYFARPDARPRPVILGDSPIDLVSTHDAESWATLTSDGTIHLGRGDAVTGSLSVDGEAIGIALSQGATLAYITQSIAVRLEPRTGMSRTFSPPAPEARLATVALTPDGRLLAVGTLEGRVLVWRDSEVAPALLIDGRAHGQRVSSLAWGSNQVLLSGSWDETALRWNPGKVAPTLEELERRHGFGLDHATRADLR